MIWFRSDLKFCEFIPFFIEHKMNEIPFVLNELWSPESYEIGLFF
jgi:hypothetical protein